MSKAPVRTAAPASTEMTPREKSLINAVGQLAQEIKEEVPDIATRAVADKIEKLASASDEMAKRAANTCLRDAEEMLETLSKFMTDPAIVNASSRSSNPLAMAVPRSRLITSLDSVLSPAKKAKAWFDIVTGG